MDHIFQLFSIITGVLVLIVGFGFHWIGQFISVVNRDLAIRFGIWETDNLPEYEVYENAMAITDVVLGWIYGIAGAGLIFSISWAYTLAWIPGFALLYHSIFFWLRTAYQKKANHHVSTTKDPLRTGWFLANFITGILTLAVAWIGVVR